MLRKPFSRENNFKKQISYEIFYENHNYFKNENSIIVDIKNTNWIIKDGFTNLLGKEIKELNLLFRASRDGFEAENYYRRCTGKANCLVLIQSGNNFISGGFNNNIIKANAGYQFSNDSFLFSLNRQTFHKIVRDFSYAIFQGPNYGPNFGGGELIIGDKCNLFCNSFSNLKKYDTQNVSDPSTWLMGISPFVVKDYEVFEVIFE